MATCTQCMCIENSCYCNENGTYPVGTCGILDAKRGAKSCFIPSHVVHKWPENVYTQTLYKIILHII